MGAPHPSSLLSFATTRDSKPIKDARAHMTMPPSNHLPHRELLRHTPKTGTGSPVSRQSLTRPHSKRTSFAESLQGNREGVKPDGGGWEGQSGQRTPRRGGSTATKRRGRAGRVGGERPRLLIWGDGYLAPRISKERGGITSFSVVRVFALTKFDFQFSEEWGYAPLLKLS